MIIFEGEELILHYHKGNTDYIIISFLSFDQTHKARDNFFLKSVVEKYDISCLGITTTVDNYYLHKEMNKIISLCNDISKNYKKVIIMGLSMGGHAALKNSKLLHADIVFALAPRFTVDKNICPIPDAVEQALSTQPKENIKRSTIQSTDLQGKIYILFDPLSHPATFDADHIKLFKNLIPAAIYIPTFFSEHLVIRHLQGSEFMKNILEALVYKDNQDIIHTISYIRRHHIHNIIAKFERYVYRNPLWVYRMIMSFTFAQVKNNHFLMKNYKLILLLTYHLNIHGYSQESSDCLKASFFYHTQDLPYNDKQIISSLNPYPYLINYHGYYLSYNFITKNLETIVNLTEKPYCLPLQLYRKNGKIKLICIHGGIIFELKYHEQFCFNLSLISDDYTPQHVKLNFADYRVFIRPINKKAYICIQPNGSITTAQIPSLWESFTAVFMVLPTETACQAELC